MGEIEFVVRLATGIACGALIGAERQWRQRGAGLRTNALVAAGAALFVILSSAFDDEISPTRVAAQVVSGVGFLGAGVIIRDGVNVRGINTAATIWCSSAVGCLAGAGLHAMALGGALGVVLANVGLRPVARRLDRVPEAGEEELVEYRLSVVCRAKREAHVRTVLVKEVNDSGFRLRGVNSEDLAEPDRVEVSAELVAEGRDDAEIERMVSRLSLEPWVSAVRWRAAADGHEERLGADVLRPSGGS
jgi:putative Mg2+ transporter-C (MgtC) family protein